MTSTTEITSVDRKWMQRAIELARRGIGSVEPNPMVGCVIAKDSNLIAEGWHRFFGGPHAEVDAISRMDAIPDGATLYVTLEPCCHHGKTPPCTDLIVRSKFKRVVIGARDPSTKVNGRGIEILKSKGIVVSVDVLAEQCQQLIAPFSELQSGKPYVIGKWAMSMDGKIATSVGRSKWISNFRSREFGHQLRGRVDAVMVGIGTVLADDPQLTARPKTLAEIKRIAARIVVDSKCQIPLTSQLVKSARSAPTLVATTNRANPKKVAELMDLGCIVWMSPSGDDKVCIPSLLAELAARRFTNVLVEGGGTLLGSLFDAGALNEVHVFIAPILIGGKSSPTPLLGLGVDDITTASRLIGLEIEQLEQDVYLRGVLKTAGKTVSAR
ncbi:MAG TPA: bifunctional diaminohydroxyphosphoribosylaminopyrimidine deaminase/5-amino-6-(5-phosphoribosylamino)uracil reductase RibD [Pirellulaceae bacterium]|nr:bifunctional diaminohydroxyphosphoribosylaminopyrimidine deaminase/5-amino-6-(5-phosphoribosylamino)uracil reductase RibD [Pirellulaceae bacterium]HMO90970.1 bifunctional diaminohydroxyphosphoribosylaminopyrimidine deaminase/5-amino-6-(5-phosphoribosylamino)uracil reductase RibD [Pirellulaceae bacterium]HMP71460.1 bifunctional diaminohydroxyphosphoribosylaminopyrimidine deaminase/5-amino-6-(5-phosphoribosylamino)uracil reductase RibD [Pirellulaceae bacterium]